MVSSIPLRVFRDLTNVSGVSYLYVDHKGGEEVCVLAAFLVDRIAQQICRRILWVPL
jgi:hypothetical protein